MSGLEKGATFNSYNEFQTVLANFCRQTNSRFVVHDCKGIERFNSGKLMCDRLPLFLKYKYAKIACERFGQPRHEGRGIRNKGSKKNGCGAHVTITAQRTKQGLCCLYVMRSETKHSNQCEIRRKQKRIIKGFNVPPHKKITLRKHEDRPKITGPRITLEVPGHNFQVKPELLADYSDDSDNSMQEYNYDVKPMVVYSDDEEEEQKPIPIYHLNENQTLPEHGEVCPERPKSTEPVEPAKQVEPAELVAPVEPTEPLEPEEPAEPAEPAEPVESAAPAKSENTEPTQASPVEEDEPTQASAGVEEDDSSDEDVKPVLPLLPEMPELPALSDSEDVKPLPLADKPSLRALLLPAMALNFSQRAVQSET